MMRESIERFQWVDCMQDNDLYLWIMFMSKPAYAKNKMSQQHDECQPTKFKHRYLFSVAVESALWAIKRNTNIGAREREEKEKIEHFTLYPSDRAEETSTFPVFALSPISRRLERFNIPIIHQSLCLHTCALSLLSGWKTRPLLGCTIVALRLVDAALLQCGTCDVVRPSSRCEELCSFQARCALSCWKCWAYKKASSSLKELYSNVDLIRVNFFCRDEKRFYSLNFFEKKIEQLRKKNTIKWKNREKSRKKKKQWKISKIDINQWGLTAKQK